ncbi:hypothetical protein FQN55_006667 [Onygenales sp. PD_40]|nr:hypothetical protein FQN55_006667 [Onygenales sp. PD_40]KAK2798049.1 hypothetical protein FQN51_007974 [Onygenales sp. PD_10]
MDTPSSLRIIDLPAEILYLIPDYLHPDDILSLISSSILSPSLLTTSHFSIQNQWGDTILHRLCYREYKEWMRGLVSRCVDISPKNHKGASPLHLAIRNLSSTTAEMFITAGALYYEPADFADGPTALHLAASRGLVETMKLLIKRGANVSKADKGLEQPIHRAALGGHLDCIQLLLDNGADISAEATFGTPLTAAIYSGPAAVEMLIRNGADVSKRSPPTITPLYDAVDNSNPEVVKILLDAGAVCDATVSLGHKYPPFHRAVWWGRGSQIHNLRGYASEVAVTRHRSGPSYWEPKWKARHDAILKLFIQAGVDVSHPCYGGLTALHLAVLKCNKDAVEMLIDAGADIFKRSDCGVSSLVAAALVEDQEICALLARRKKEVELDPVVKKQRRQNAPKIKPKPSFLRSRSLDEIRGLPATSQG